MPLELTSFVGRRRDLDELKRLVTASRLVTLTGVGGTGKTRLGLRLAAAVQRAFGDGVWLVDLTQLPCLSTRPDDGEGTDMLAYLVMAAIELRQDVGPPVHQLIHHLADRETLLVLDNCEHLLPACAVLVDALLRACPRLRVVATSRESLGVGGEVLYPVPALPTPAPDQRLGPAELSRCDSVALFLVRAQTVAPGFALTEGNREAVAELCRRLDGLPLAIELAAARIRVLSPQQVVDRLGDRFGLLSSGGRTATDRRQTLRGCVDWSFELCSKPEQRLWARLSVFVGGFHLDAVEGICAGEDLSTGDLLDLVAGLVDKSIVVRAETGEGSGGQARYRLLDTIRDYGREKLVEAGDEATVRSRHRDWYQHLVARARRECYGHRQAYWYTRLVDEHPNLRAALEYCLTGPDQAEAALRILVDLPRAFWSTHRVVSEGVSWLDRALAQAATPTALRAQALILAGGLALFFGDTAAMTRRLSEGVGLARRLNDRHALALGAYVIAHSTLWRNDLSGALAAAEEGLRALSEAGEPDAALRLQLLLHVVQAAALAGEHDRTAQAYREILRATEHSGETSCRSYAMWAYGLVGWRANEVAEAGRRVAQGLRLRHAAGLWDPRHVALSIELLAWIAARQRRYRRAATLLGAADALWTIRGTRIPSERMLIADHEACERQVLDALGEAALTDAFRHGRSLPLDDLFAYALEQRQSATRTPPAVRGTTSPLTRREQQIADLIANGMANKDIASALVISRRTAESHVEHILAKLGFTNRTQIAAWIATLRSDAWSCHPSPCR